MIDPENGSELWNKLRFGGMRSPGVVRLSGNDLKIGWDNQNATGTSGAITKRINEPLKEFDAEFELSNEDDGFGNSEFDEWDAFQALLESSASRDKPAALDIYHPDLARNHITAVTLASISGCALDGKGGGKIKVHFIEFRPPKPAPAASSTKAGPKSEQDEELDRARAKKALLKSAPEYVGEPPRVVGSTLGGGR